MPNINLEKLQERVNIILNEQKELENRAKKVIENFYIMKMDFNDYLEKINCK